MPCVGLVACVFVLAIYISGSVEVLESGVLYLITAVSEYHIYVHSHKVYVDYGVELVTANLTCHVHGNEVSLR